MYHRERQVQERGTTGRRGEQESRRGEKRRRGDKRAEERRRRGAEHDIIMIMDSQRRLITGSMTESTVKYSERAGNFRIKLYRL